MTVKMTLSFTDRHHRYLLEKVGQGVFATRSAAVAAAIEQMMQAETERNGALSALAEEIRMRCRHRVPSSWTRITFSRPLAP